MSRFLSSLKKFVINLDLMTDGPNLKFEGKRSYQTVIGGLFNLILIVSTAVGIIYFGKELWKKMNQIL